MSRSICETRIEKIGDGESGMVQSDGPMVIKKPSHLRYLYTSPHDSLEPIPIQRVAPIHGAAARPSLILARNHASALYLPLSHGAYHARMLAVGHCYLGVAQSHVVVAGVLPTIARP